MTKVLRTKTQYYQYYPPIHGPNLVAYTESDKAEAFALSFENQCAVNIQNIDIDHLEMVEEFVEEFQETPPDLEEALLEFVTPKEVCTLLSQLPTRKSTGFDKILHKLLRILPKKPVIALVGQ